MKAIFRNQCGFSLVVVIIVLALLLWVTGAGLFFSSLNLKSTNNLKGGTSAMQAADAGIQHALALIPAGGDFNSFWAGTGLANFPCKNSSGATGTCDGTNYKPTLMASLAGYSYIVEVTNDTTVTGETATNDINKIVILNSTANGPNGTRKVIKAYIGRGSFGIGATSLPGSTAPNTETNFSGTSFSINGNDNCHAAPAVPGIAVTDAALATEITNATTSDGGLASDQMNLVTGAGGAPSVATIPPLSQTVSQIADGYLALPHTDLDGGNYSGNGNWGTSSTPRITRVTGDVQIQGTIEGYGVLIVDGALDISGNFTFHGLVIARGNVQVQITGNAGIYGSLLIKESTVQDAAYELDVRGNAHIQYDSCALGAADSWATLPKTTRLSAWQEVM